MPALTQKEFEEKIETMLKDTQKGLATKEELKSAVNEVVTEKFATEKAVLDGELKEAKLAVDDLAKANKTLAAEIKQIKRNRFSAIKTSDGRYNGVWSNHEEARNFGMFILASIAGVPGAKKYCEDMGIDTKAVTGEPMEKAMGEDYPSTGGVLVPAEFIPNMITLMESYGVFRRNAQEWPMGSESSYAPMITCLLYTSPSPRDGLLSRMPSSA